MIDPYEGLWTALYFLVYCAGFTAFVAIITSAVTVTVEQWKQEQRNRSARKAVTKLLERQDETN